MQPSNEVPKDTTTSIMVRFLECKDNGDLVIKKENHDHDGYYKFLIDKKELENLMNVEDPKSNLYEHFAINYNRSFMEFLMQEINSDNLYLVSIYIDDYEKEYSYMESEYMDETYLYDSIRNLYDEEFGMMSDFDYYPYGLVNLKIN